MDFLSVNLAEDGRIRISAVQPGLGVCHPALVSVWSFRGEPTHACSTRQIYRSFTTEVPGRDPAIAGGLSWPAPTPGHGQAQGSDVGGYREFPAPGNFSNI
jgi:hypothetical protein